MTSGRFVEDNDHTRAIEHQIAPMDRPGAAGIGRKRLREIGVLFVAVELGHVQQ